jgi:acyl-CoA synthetase (AMP-forming)/AMP-acid ligase II
MPVQSSSGPLQRLRQTTNHLSSTHLQEDTSLAIVHGPLFPQLQEQTLGELLDLQASTRGEQECLVISYSGVRWTYAELQKQSVRLAKGLLALGVRRGDRVGILASNCEEYVASFFATGLVGGILVVLNSGYTCVEAGNALRHSGQSFLHFQLLEKMSDDP